MPNKGYKQTIEHIENAGRKRIGRRKYPNEIAPKICRVCKNVFEKGVWRNIISWRQARYCSWKCTSTAKIGTKASLSAREKMSEVKKGIKPKNLELLRTPEVRAKAKASMRIGEESSLWIKDRSLLQRYNDDAKDRRSSAYGAWRKGVKDRDNYKCRMETVECSGRIEVHHILGWTRYPELRYNINNGITLCHAHHPLKRAEEKRLIPFFQGLVSVSNV